MLCGGKELWHSDDLVAAAMCYHSSWVAPAANWVEKAGSPIILLQPPLLAIVQCAIVQFVQCATIPSCICELCIVQCTPIPPSNPALILTHPKWCMCLHSSTTSSLFSPPMTTCIQISTSPLGLEPLSSVSLLGGFYHCKGVKERFDLISELLTAMHWFCFTYMKCVELRNR